MIINIIITGIFIILNTKVVITKKTKINNNEFIIVRSDKEIQSAIRNLTHQLSIDIPVHKHDILLNNGIYILEHRVNTVPNLDMDSYEAFIATNAISWLEGDIDWDDWL